MKEMCETRYAFMEHAESLLEEIVEVIRFVEAYTYLKSRIPAYRAETSHLFTFFDEIVTRVFNNEQKDILNEMEQCFGEEFKSLGYTPEFLFDKFSRTYEDIIYFAQAILLYGIADQVEPYEHDPGLESKKYYDLELELGQHIPAFEEYVLFYYDENLNSWETKELETEQDKLYSQSLEAQEYAEQVLLSDPRSVGIRLDCRLKDGAFRTYFVAERIKDKEILYCIPCLMYNTRYIRPLMESLSNDLRR